jgi:molecular chaperone GrpE
MSKNNKVPKNQNIDEEFVYEEDGVADDNLISKIDKLKEKLKSCQKEKQEYLDGWQRSKADYINLKKRSDEEKDQIKQYANENLINDILGVLDSFEMAFKDKEAWNNAPENWRKGIEFIHTQLVSTLQNYGISEINPLGEKFNPELHSSAELLETADKNKDGIILEVLQKGYKLKEKNIRFATVKVGHFKE